MADGLAMTPLKQVNIVASVIYLSSTSWNKQLGVCVVVKILLVGGILGAEKRTNSL